MDRSRKRQLRELNARAWAGEKDVFPVANSLDTSLKKNTAFIKRLRTSISGASEATCLAELKTLSLHKYLSEVISASYEGLSKCKTPAEIAAGVEIVSGLHQRFGPAEYTCYLGWWLGRGLTTPDKVALKNLTAEAKDKEEKERLARQRILLKVVTELWLVGLLRSLEDVSRPDDANAKGKEGSAAQAGKLGEALKGKVPTKNVDIEAFPLEVLKDLLGHDREHANLSLVVHFVKSFAWDVLGVGGADKGRQSVEADGVVKADESWADEAEAAAAPSSDPPLTSPELQERFKGILNRYLEDVKQHAVRDQRAVASQAKKNAEIYVKSGEVFEDRQASYAKQLKAQERLVSNIQILCDFLGSEMPELQEKDEADGAASGGIGLIKAGEYLRGQSDGAGIWEDDEERRFYENLVDLKDRVPGILLEEPKKKKDENEQVGKKVDPEAPKEEKLAETPEEQSTTITNKTVGAQVDALLLRLPEMQTKDAADQIAVDFCFSNSKASRNRLIKALEDVPKGRSDLYPLYARLTATLGRYLTDITHGLVSYLDDEFRSLQRRKQKDFLGQVRTGNIRYLAELTKFGIVPEHVIFHCLKVSLDDFSRMNIEIIANLMENCGRYLLRNPETAPRMKSFIETLQRKKAAHVLGQQERMLVENAVYYVNPPERAAIEQKERTPVELYVRKLVYFDLNKRTYTKVLKSIRKLHWEEEEVVAILKKIFSRPAKVKYSNIHLLAILVGALYRYHQDFVVSVLDDVLEHVILGLEQNDFKFNQRRVAEVKYLGELYNYKMVDSPVIFSTMYRIVGFGHPQGTPTPGHYNPLDPPDEFFRIRLICNLLDTCGTCFDRGAAKKKLDFFLHFFQYYIRTKMQMPMDIEFIVQDTFSLVRPQWTLAADLDEAGRLFAEACAEAYKSNEVEKATEVEEPDEEESSDEADVDDLPPDAEDGVSKDGLSTDDEADEAEDIKNDSDFEEIVVTRQQEERDPEADAEFDRELAKLMTESVDSRKVDRKPMFDVPLPVRKKETEDEGTPNTMAFSLMTKKGNRAQTRTIALPSDSTFAVAMRSRQEAERAEQQRIKSLVLNYDLGEPEHDGLADRHEHAHNASLRPPNPTSKQERDRPGHKGAQRSRKLQLSDVDW